MPDTSSPRARAITWSDPLISAQAARTMSGRDFLEAITRGDVPIPPILSLLGIMPQEVRDGSTVFIVDPAEYHYNPIGTVHGGLLSTLCDSAMGCAIHSLLPGGTSYTTLELKVNFLRPLTLATGRVTCTGSVIHLGNRVATAEARVAGQDGKLYAHATTTCLILRAEPETGRP